LVAGRPFVRTAEVADHTAEDIAHCTGASAEDTVHMVVMAAEIAYNPFAVWVFQHFVLWDHHNLHRNSHRVYFVDRNLSKEQRLVVPKLQG